MNKNKSLVKYVKLVLILAVALPVLYYFLTLNAFEDATQVRADVDGEYVELTPGSTTLFTQIKDKFKNFKLSKIGGTDKKTEDKDYYMIDSRKPKIRFKRPTDSDSIDFFRVIVFYTEGNWKKKSEKTYIDHLDNVIVTNNDKQLVKEDDYEVTYTKSYIEVKPKDDDFKLKKGQYFFMIRAFDTDLNYTDSGKIKVKVVDSLEDETTPKLSGDITIKVEKVGTVLYNDKFKLFYYSNPSVKLTGHVTPTTAPIDLQVFVGGTMTAELKTDAAGAFLAPLSLKPGANNVQLKTKGITDSGMQITKDLSITIR